MALQSSGAISMSQINTELGRSSTAQISLDTAENGGYAAINTCGSPRPSSSNPATMSEWYGYNHSAACCPAYGTYQYSSCGVFCLDGDTLVTMADGTTKKISLIQKDDVVSSRDIEGMPDESPNKEHLTVQLSSLNYTVSTAVVRATIATTAEAYFNINNGLLLATDAHEHFVLREGVWRIILTVNLRVGDIFLKEDGSMEPITSIELVNESKDFYNIDVENLDMYVANGIVTHNSKGTTNPCNTYYWYADGSCGVYYVDQGYTPSACGCTVNVTIDFHVPSSAICWSSYNFAATSSDTLLTGVTVTYTWYGDLGGYMSGSVTIPQGTSCNSGAFGNNQTSCWGENYSTYVVNINPTSFGSQDYIEGNTFTSGLYPC
jgi:hypothetical protein